MDVYTWCLIFGAFTAIGVVFTISVLTDNDDRVCSFKTWVASFTCHIPVLYVGCMTCIAIVYLACVAWLVGIVVVLSMCCAFGCNVYAAIRHVFIMPAATVPADN